VEIHHTGIGLPFFYGLAYSGVIQGRPPTEPSREALLRADVVTREDMQTTEAAQEHILGCPTPHAAQLSQARVHSRVCVTRQVLDSDATVPDTLREGQQCLDLLPAEADRPKV
jgi:hypothetical protein